MNARYLNDSLYMDEDLSFSHAVYISPYTCLASRPRIVVVSSTSVKFNILIII